MKRWLAEIDYRAQGDVVTVQYDIDELEELQDLVERGPDWNSLIQIRVTLQLVTDPDMTFDMVK